MTMVAVTSACASPGASALAVALGMARCRTAAGDVVVVEADPAGGRLGPRFGLRADPSLATYVSDARRGSSVDLVLANTQPIGSLAVLPCPADPELTRQVLARGGEALAAVLGEEPLDAVVDLGRLGDPALMPFAVCASQVLLVARPRFDEVQALVFRRRLLAEAGCRVGLVTVGDEPHRPDEVAAFADLPLMATLPDDPAVASAFCGGRFDSKRLVRTRLWSTVLGLADRLWPGTGVVEPAGTSEPDEAEPPSDPVSGEPAPGEETAARVPKEPAASRVQLQERAKGSAWEPAR